MNLKEERTKTLESKKGSFNNLFIWSNRNKGGFQQQQGNKYAYQDEEEEFDGEIEDLENDQGVFDYGNYGSGSQQKGAEKKLGGGGQAGFIKSLADKKAQEKPNDEMDFILDDPDNLDNFSDY